MEANAHRRPRGWKFPEGYQQGQSERAHATVGNAPDGDGYELLMCNIDRSHSEVSEILCSLEDPNIFVGDTAASVHTTGCMNGMVNVRQANPGSILQVCNATPNPVTYIGDIPGTVYNKDEEELTTGILRKVHYSPQQTYNIISIPQMLLEGWILSGTKEALMITSPNGHTILFDLIIPTKEGCVYACYFDRRLESASISVHYDNSFPTPTPIFDQFAEDEEEEDGDNTPLTQQPFDTPVHKISTSQEDEEDKFKVEEETDSDSTLTFCTEESGISPSDLYHNAD